MSYLEANGCNNEERSNGLESGEDSLIVVVSGDDEISPNSSSQVPV